MNKARTIFLATKFFLYFTSVFIVSTLTFGYSSFNTRAQYSYASKFQKCIDRYGSTADQLAKIEKEKKTNPSLMISNYAENCYERNGCLNPCGSLCEYVVKDNYSYQEYLLYLTSLPFSQINNICVEACIEICMLPPNP